MPSGWRLRLFFRLDPLSPTLPSPALPPLWFDRVEFKVVAIMASTIDEEEERPVLEAAWWSSWPAEVDDDDDGMEERLPPLPPLSPPMTTWRPERRWLPPLFRRPPSSENKKVPRGRRRDGGGFWEGEGRRAAPFSPPLSSVPPSASPLGALLFCRSLAPRVPVVKEKESRVGEEEEEEEEGRGAVAVGGPLLSLGLPTAMVDPVNNDFRECTGSLEFVVIFLRKVGVGEGTSTPPPPFPMVLWEGGRRSAPSPPPPGALRAVVVVVGPEMPGKGARAGGRRLALFPGEEKELESVRW